MRLERLKILETFEAMTPIGRVKVQGFRIDDLFALTPAISDDFRVAGEPGFVTHIPSGFTPLGAYFFTFEQACLFVRLLQALPINWNFKDRDDTTTSGVHPDIICDLADIAIAVRP